MTEMGGTEQPGITDRDPAGMKAQRKVGLKLLKKLLVYHAALAAILLVIATMFPSFLQELPIGGVRNLEQGGDVTVQSLNNQRREQGETEIVNSFLGATSQLDRLSYARKLTIIIISVLLLMLPVSWVNRSMHQGDEHDHSLDETTLILPGVVASIVVVVQHSLPLAFSLAGIVAGVQFRRALQDTYDALFILAAIGVGLAAGIEALEIAAILSIFFAYATLYVAFWGDGLETHYILRKKLEKKQRKAAEGKKDQQEEEGVA